jgi:hypothetical protein
MAHWKILALLAPALIGEPHIRRRKFRRLGFSTVWLKRPELVLRLLGKASSKAICKLHDFF